MVHATSEKSAPGQEEYVPASKSRSPPSCSFPNGRCARRQAFANPAVHAKDQPQHRGIKRVAAAANARPCKVARRLLLAPLADRQLEPLRAACAISWSGFASLRVDVDRGDEKRKKATQHTRAFLGRYVLGRHFAAPRRSACSIRSIAPIARSRAE
jgi:hypothetical protein